MRRLYVKSKVPDNRIALWEKHPAHPATAATDPTPLGTITIDPTNEVMVSGSDPVLVAETPAVKLAILEGRLELVDEAGEAPRVRNRWIDEDALSGELGQALQVWYTNAGEVGKLQRRKHEAEQAIRVAHALETAQLRRARDGMLDDVPHDVAVLQRAEQAKKALPAIEAALGSAVQHAQAAEERVHRLEARCHDVARELTDRGWLKQTLARGEPDLRPVSEAYRELAGLVGEQAIKARLGDIILIGSY